jgi:hypothetical protein
MLAAPPLDKTLGSFRRRRFARELIRLPLLGGISLGSSTPTNHVTRLSRDPFVYNRPRSTHRECLRALQFSLSVGGALLLRGVDRAWVRAEYLNGAGTSARERTSRRLHAFSP